MTHGLQIAGGIIALAGGSVILVAVLLHLSTVIAPLVTSAVMIQWFFNLIIALLVIIGGILALTGKRVGGGLSISAAFL